jgi:flagellar protein FliS
MTRIPNAKAYRAVEVQASSPGERIVFLYDQILVRLIRAEKLISAGDIAGKAENLIRANEIVLALAEILDHEKGGEIASQLESLYLYFSQTILEINRHNDLDKLKALTTMIRSLHEAWQQATSMERASPIAP